MISVLAHFKSGDNWLGFTQNIDRLFESHEYARAVQELSKGMELYQDPALLAQLHYGRGIARARLEHTPQALEDFSAAVRLSPEFADAYELRGMCRVRTEAYDLAIDDFTCAIDLGAENAQTFRNRGDAYLLLKMVEFAFKDFAEAARRDPSQQSHLIEILNECRAPSAAGKINAVANGALATHYLGRSEEALRELNTAIGQFTDPHDSALLHCRIAQIKISLHEYGDALNHTSRAIMQMADDHLPYLLRAVAHQRLGAVEEARAAYSQCAVVASRWNIPGARVYQQICMRCLDQLEKVA